MAVNLQHLRAFHAVATEGSIVQAARRLSLSQSTVSEQVRELELRHKVALLQGRKPPLALTTAGQDLFVLTQRLFAVSVEIDGYLTEAVQPSGQEIRLASDSPTYAARMVHLLLAMDRNARPKVRLGNANEALSWLKSAEVDAAICSDPIFESGLHYQLLYRDELKVALHSAHKLVAEQTIDLAELATDCLLVREKTSRTRAGALSVLAQADVEPIATLELHTRETIREAIALGVGYSFFYSAECPPDPRIVYRSIKTAHPVFTGYLVCSNEQRRTPMMKLLLSVAGSLVLQSPLAV
jgi:LysR family transcriptional regulator, low CO2-responsive transcriptional regulator